MSTFFSADICLARVLAKRARARVLVRVPILIERKWLRSPQALGWEHGASEKRKTGDKQVAREGDDDGGSTGRIA